MHPTVESERFEHIGIRALARAADSGHWFFGHFAAALLSGAWPGARRGLDLRRSLFECGGVE